MTLLCPACRGAMETLTLEPPRKDPVDLDACGKCGALWFDKGELERTSMRKVTRRETTEQVAWKCPRCRDRLYADQLGDGNRVYGCEKCRGVLVEGETVRASLKLHAAAKSKGLFDELGGICPGCGEWGPDLSQNPSDSERCVACARRERLESGGRDIDDPDDKIGLSLGPIKLWLDRS